MHPETSDKNAGQDAERWLWLLSQMDRAQCLPIIGPALLEPFIGNRRDIALAWADRYAVALQDEQRADLAQVARYLSVSQDSRFPREEMPRWSAAELQRRFPDLFPATKGKIPAADAWKTVGAMVRERDPADPFKVLAGLSLPIYLSANADTLLEDALAAVGKVPESIIIPWNDALYGAPSIFNTDPSYTPSLEHPLVVHFFGLFDQPDSLVLTEDDFNDVLLSVNRSQDVIPNPVREMIASASHLWLGFNPDEAPFKTLYRILRELPGHVRLRENRNLIQIDLPATGSAAEMQQYIERFFQGEEVDVYWGSTQDFISELQARISENAQVESPPIAQTTDPYASPVAQTTDPYEAVQQTADRYEVKAPIAQTADSPPAFTPPAPTPADLPPAFTPAAPTPADLPPAPTPRDNPITVIMHSLEERYQPPAQVLEVEIRRNQVEVSYADRRYRSPFVLDQAAILAAGLPRRYGELLFAAIFSDTALSGFDTTRLAYDRARSDAGDLLRIVLDIESQDAELNRLKWEYLCDPRRPTDPPLSAVERAPLYRLQGGGMAQPVEARPLKVLVAICNPPGLGDPASSNTLLRNLAAIDSEQQQAIVQDALQRLSEAKLVEYQILGGPAGPPATLKALREAIEDGYHVLHLIAHGVMIKDTYHIVIEPGDEKPPFVPADTMRNTLTGHKLQLVVLAPCRSAETANGAPDSGVSFGALLVNNGIPAVIAMQDLVQITTVQHFTQHFYDDLARSGRVDTALAATRYALYSWLGDDDGDWGTPVLYLGVEDGELLKVDIAGANRLARRDPVIRGFSKHADKGVEVARRVAERLEREGVAGLTPDQLQVISNAVASPTATAVSALVPGQQREQLADLQRPVKISAAELQDYVENQGSRLLLPKALYNQVAAALNIGKHIILIGPPGTGKTSLAQDIGHFAAHPARRFTNDAVVTTASADWSTFDTVGGYVPAADQTLQFRPGVFLRAISAAHWLIIDEINRAEIDKAFGELFTVLSGQPVVLPYQVGPNQVQVIPSPAGRDADKPWVPPTAKTPYDYVVHPNWRIIGAMNVYDRASLFAMSFAFMRRFAFIDMDVPPPELYDTLVPRWAGKSALPDAERDQLLERVRALLTMRLLMDRRALGPAIIKDMVQHVCECFLPGGSVPDLLCEAFALYAVPQLDALDQESIIGIYAALQQDFVDAPGAQAMLARIRVLYPHIRSEDWP